MLIYVVSPTFMPQEVITLSSSRSVSPHDMNLLLNAEGGAVRPLMRHVERLVYPSILSVTSLSRACTEPLSSCSSVALPTMCSLGCLPPLALRSGSANTLNCETQRRELLSIYNIASVEHKTWALHRVGDLHPVDPLLGLRDITALRSIGR